MVPGGRKLGDGHTLRGDKPGPQLFPVPLSATHPATAHCPTTGPRSRLLALKTCEVRSLDKWGPLSSVAPSQQQKAHQHDCHPFHSHENPNLLLSVCFVSPPPPGKPHGGIDSFPHGAAVKKKQI